MAATETGDAKPNVLKKNRYFDDDNILSTYKKLTETKSALKEQRHFGFEISGRNLKKRPLPRKEKVKGLRRNFHGNSISDQIRKSKTVLLNAEQIQKYDYGAAEMKPSTAKTKFARDKFEKRKVRYVERSEQAARAEALHTEQSGFIEVEDGEYTFNISQKEIVQQADIAAATKRFTLNLAKWGPYRIDYSRNGRHLLLGGRRGHVAAFDWMTKRLHSEINVIDTVTDVQWLHVNTMYAVAQKRWCYIYDMKGVELHCLKTLFDVKRLEFLPYHFLLAAGSNTSFLHWLDITIGEIISSFPTKLGPINLMTQNPSNAIVHCGHPNGVVTLWSPNVKEPLVRMLTHACPVKGLSVDCSGNYMATTGMDNKLRIWDIRKYCQVHSYTLPYGCIGQVAFSQKGMLAMAIANSVQIFKEPHLGQMTGPYLGHICRGTVTDLKFCPYEDVLAIGHQQGLDSILVPGCGEPNFDALEANPYQSKKQRQEHEVKALLDKIQPELISLDPQEIATVDRQSLQDTMTERANVLFLKPQSVHYTPRYRTKARSSALNKEHRKQSVLEERRRARNKERKEIEKEIFRQGHRRQNQIKESVLDRFRPKDA